MLNSGIDNHPKTRYLAYALFALLLVCSLGLFAKPAYAYTITVAPLSSDGKINLAPNPGYHAKAEGFTFLGTIDDVDIYEDEEVEDNHLYFVKHGKEFKDYCQTDDGMLINPVPNPVGYTQVWEAVRDNRQGRGRDFKHDRERWLVTADTSAEYYDQMGKESRKVIGLKSFKKKWIAPDNGTAGKKNRVYHVEVYGKNHNYTGHYYTRSLKKAKKLVDKFYPGDQKWRKKHYKMWKSGKVPYDNTAFESEGYYARINIVFYSDPDKGVPVYQLFNKKYYKVGRYDKAWYYTTSKAEVKKYKKRGYKNQGVMCYGVDMAKSNAKAYERLVKLVKKSEGATKVPVYRMPGYIYGSDTLACTDEYTGKWAAKPANQQQALYRVDKKGKYIPDDETYTKVKLTQYKW